MNQTGRVLDFFAEAHPFFAAPHAFGEAARGRETLGQVAAANHREHRGGAEALMAALRADVADAAAQRIDGEIVLPGLVVSRAEIIVGHRARSDIGLDCAELERALADLD